MKSGKYLTSYFRGVPLAGCLAAAHMQSNASPPFGVHRSKFRANSGLKSQEYSAPVLGLIFLRFAEVRFAAQRLRIEGTAASSRRGSRVDDPAAYHAEGVLYLTPNARYDQLLALPEAT